MVKLRYITVGYLAWCDLYRLLLNHVVWFTA